MDAKDETKKTFLTEPIKLGIKYVLGLLGPFILASIPKVRDWIQSTISYTLLLIIASALLSALLLASIYIYVLRKRVNQSTSLTVSERQVKLELYPALAYIGHDETDIYRDDISPTFMGIVLEIRSKAAKESK